MRVIIVGGGWAGCAAALSAKKRGAETILIERTDMLLGTGLVGGIMRNNGRYTATEELIAELGASFLCAEYNIEGDLQHSEYIHSWIKEMEDDYKLIFKAAARASQAHRLIKENHSTLSSSGDEVAA